MMCADAVHLKRQGFSCIIALPSWFFCPHLGSLGEIPCKWSHWRHLAHALSRIFGAALVFFPPHFPYLENYSVLRSCVTVRGNRFSISEKGWMQLSLKYLGVFQQVFKFCWVFSCSFSFCDAYEVTNPALYIHEQSILVILHSHVRDTKCQF